MSTSETRALQAVGLTLTLTVGATALPAPS